MIVQKEQLFVQFDGIAWEDRGGGVRRKIMAYADQLMGAYVEFKRDAAGALHSPPRVPFTCSRSGAFSVYIGSESRGLHGGDFYFIPPDVVHGVEARKDSILVDVFTPMREDLLTAENSPAVNQPSSTAPAKTPDADR